MLLVVVELGSWMLGVGKRFFCWYIRVGIRVVFVF